MGVDDAADEAVVLGLVRGHPEIPVGVLGNPVDRLTGLIGEIRENDRVEFELKEGKKGMNAVNVRAI